MGFIGNQAVFAVANALGARTISAPTTYASAHGGFTGRSNWVADPQVFRKDVAFLISQRPAVLIIGYVPRPNLADIIATQLADYKGVVLLDPVIGDYQKGCTLAPETARAIRDQLHADRANRHAKPLRSGSAAGARRRSATHPNMRFSTACSNSARKR